jgi:Na+-driven multidrug efflux pump
LYPTAVAQLFFDDPVGLDAMKRTFKVIFISILIESLSGVLLSTIQGIGSTIQAFYVEFITVSLYMVAAACVTIWYPQPIWIIWRVEWIYFSFIGLGSWIFLRREKWMQAENR